MCDQNTVYFILQCTDTFCNKSGTRQFQSKFFFEDQFSINEHLKTINFGITSFVFINII